MRKPAIVATEQTSSRETRSELTNEQLCQVSGGSLYHACATGKHFQNAQITVR